MATKEIEKEKRGGGPGRWAYCPVCFRERRFTVDGVMVPHRMWMSGFPGHPYGYMKRCLGTGIAPAENKITYDGRKAA